MTRRSWFIPILAILLTGSAPSVPAEVTLAGTEFWACDLNNDGPANGEPFGLVVANPQADDVTVSVEAAGGSLDSAVIPAGGVHAFALDRSRRMVGTDRRPNAYHVTASAPVRAVQVNPLTPLAVFSSDVSTLLPVDRLGTVYRPLSRESYLDTLMFCDDLPGSIAVVAVAVEPTTVTIVPNAPVRAGGLPASPAGTPITATLARFDVLQVVTETGHGTDLTGSLVVSDRPIAVFGGSPTSFVPETQVAAEHLEEQMLPVETWGRDFLLVKSKQRTTEPDHWRVVAAEDGTGITVTPAVVPSFMLNAGEHREIVTAEDVRLQSSAPVEVGQYFVGAGPTPGVSPGDPSMLVAVPLEQFGDEHLVVIPETPAHPEDWLTLVREPATPVTLDGSAVPAPSFTPIGATGWERAWIRVGEGPHRVVAGGPVGVSFYGYGDYAAYGSHAGARLESNGKVTCAAVAGPVSCADGSVVLDGSASFGPAALGYLWSSLTPGLTIADPDRPVTTARLGGAATGLVALTVSTATDSSTCSVTIPGDAGIAPPDLGCPALVSSLATRPGFADLSVLADARDDCDPSPAVVNDRTGGGADASDAYPCGETLVTFTATDSGGHASSCVTRVVVSDAAPPAAISEIDGRRLRVARDPADDTLLQVTFEAPASAADAVSLYAGTLSPRGIVAYDHVPIACHAVPAVVAPGVASLPAPLAPGRGRYYLVSSSNCLGESTRGSRSDGVLRPALPTDCGAIR